MYIEQQNKLRATLFPKSNDRQNFFNAKSEHPHSLKESIPFSQTRRIEFNKYANIPGLPQPL